jgi:aldehyde dehydrogenase (NAD+)
MNAADRGKIMYKFADLIEKHGDEIAALEALDNGKPAKIAKIADVPLVVNTIRYYAGWCDKIHGKTLPISGPHFAYLREEPVGVVG